MTSLFHRMGLIVPAVVRLNSCYETEKSLFKRTSVNWRRNFGNTFVERRIRTVDFSCSTCCQTACTSLVLVPVICWNRFSCSWKIISLFSISSQSMSTRTICKTEIFIFWLILFLSATDHFIKSIFIQLPNIFWFRISLKMLKDIVKTG